MQREKRKSYVEKKGKSYIKEKKVQRFVIEKDKKNVRKWKKKVGVKRKVYERANLDNKNLKFYVRQI